MTLYFKIQGNMSGNLLHLGFHDAQVTTAFNLKIEQMKGLTSCRCCTELLNVHQIVHGRDLELITITEELLDKLVGDEPNLD